LGERSGASGCNHSAGQQCRELNTGTKRRTHFHVIYGR
jgi:hypothetical protein